MAEERYNAAGEVVEYDDNTGRYEPVEEDTDERVAPEAPEEPVRNEEAKAEDDAGTKTSVEAAKRV